MTLPLDSDVYVKVADTIWSSFDPHHVAKSLAEDHHERAREEALQRALMSERRQDRAGVDFWLSVHQALSS